MQRPAKPAKDAERRSALGGLGGGSKEPIKIDADKLDVLDKDNKAVFSGNVVAVQGETTVRCSVMTVFYEGRGQGGAPRPAQPAAQSQGQGNDGAIKRIECSGPVTVVSKTQAATSDNAVFDRANNKVIMTGNVALMDGILYPMRMTDFGLMGFNAGVISNAAAPFGGVKQSGMGREGGAEGIEEYTSVQYLGIRDPYANA